MKILPIFLLLLVAACLSFPFALNAAELTLDLSAGYDDNAAEVPDGDGSGFVQYAMHLDQPLGKEKWPVFAGLFVEGTYRQYVDLEDNYLLRAGGQVTFLPPGDRLQPGVFGEVACFRDELVLEDEYNRYLIGAAVQWLASARFSMALRQMFGETDYTNDVSAPGERSLMIGRGRRRGNSGGVPEAVATTYSRTDTVRTTRVESTWYLSPAFQIDLSCHYTDLDATAVYESYQEIGGLLRVLWHVSADWTCSGEGYWAVLDYENAPDEMAREDDFSGAGIEMVRSFRMTDVFFRIDWGRNDSPLAGETFEKMVTQCGAIISF